MKRLKSYSLLIIIILYLIFSFIIRFKNNTLFLNIINPWFYFLILIYLMLTFKNSYIRLAKNKNYLIKTIIIAFDFSVFYFYLGFIFAFGKSPFNHNILGIINNFIIQIIPIIGIELIRTILLIRHKNKPLFPIFITIITILLELNFYLLITTLTNSKLLFQYICSTILPLIANHILYTYLSLKSEYPLPLIFRIFNKLFILLLPILPTFNWFINGSIELIKTTLIYLIFKYNIIKERKKIPKKETKLKEKFSYALALFLVIIYIGFMIGKFQYEPIAILSNSMDPIFNRGDVVIFKKLKEKELENLKINTIIIYKIETKKVAHRIIKIEKEKDETFYITKGDKNNTPDIKKVNSKQIEGIYQFHIKYLGFPSIWLNEK